MACLWCHCSVTEALTIRALFSLRSLDRPAICPACLAKFPKVAERTHCPGCKKAQPKATLCADCQMWQRLFPEECITHQALFYYGAQMQQYFQRFKGQGDYRLRALFAQQLRSVLQPQKKTLFVFIPTKPAHFLQRGFDPVAALFDHFVQPTPLLTKLDTTMPQAKKNRSERLATPQFFEFSGAYHQLRHVERIWLLDDIYTTGRTLFHARACLREAGYEREIVSFSLVRS